jgi:hypothetical protein
MIRPKAGANGSFLFQVDILVSAGTNGAALEQLLHALNEGQFADYRIKSGIQIGNVIEEALAEESKNPTAVPIPIRQEPTAVELRINDYIKANKLIRLNINKGRGVRMNIPCRIVNYDSVKDLLTVYHVDEKQVYTVKFNEIDDFIELS